MQRSPEAYYDATAHPQLQVRLIPAKSRADNHVAPHQVPAGQHHILGFGVIRGLPVARSHSSAGFTGNVLNYDGTVIKVN